MLLCREGTFRPCEELVVCEDKFALLLRHTLFSQLFCVLYPSSVALFVFHLLTWLLVVLLVPWWLSIGKYSTYEVVYDDSQLNSISPPPSSFVSSILGWLTAGLTVIPSVSVMLLFYFCSGYSLVSCKPFLLNNLKGWGMRTMMNNRINCRKIRLQEIVSHKMFELIRIYFRSSTYYSDDKVFVGLKSTTNLVGQKDYNLKLF